MEAVVARPGQSTAHAVQVSRKAFKDHDEACSVLIARIAGMESMAKIQVGYFDDDQDHERGGHERKKFVSSLTQNRRPQYISVIRK